MSTGIDYGMGVTNRDLENGIRYGVIPINHLSSWALECSEAVYPDTVEVECPSCGSCFETENSDETFCDNCNAEFSTSYAWDSVEPIGYDYTPNDPEYTTESDETDIFVTKSPFYTRADFCSPCAPGACYLLSPNPEGEKAYCLGHDFFEEGKAPYPVYRVVNDSEVLPETEESA